MEQEEYTREEIDWSYIEFIDNQDILDMIEKVELISLQLNLYSSSFELFHYMPMISCIYLYVISRGLLLVIIPIDYCY